MQIILESLGKKYNREWIFRKLTYTFDQGQSYAVTGLNGSGKSTLLQVISGVIPCSEGRIDYVNDKQQILADDIFKHLSISTPYLELIEEFTLQEQLDFHFSFKNLRSGEDLYEILKSLKLDKALNKNVKNFSSGMKQRLKLALAFYSDTPILLLDEPTSNLDAQGIEWYQQSIMRVMADRITIICSNQKNEYGFCDKILDLMAFK